MLLELLKQITLNNFLASTVKRFGLYAAEYSLLTFVAPTWMSTPLRYIVMTATGSASKNLFWWVISPSSSEQNCLDQPIVFIGNEEELSDLSFVVVNPSSNGYQLSYRTIKNKIKDSTKAVINSAGNYILNITMNDLMEGTGASIGSSTAAGAFVIFMGAPSLLTLPLYFLMEGSAKSFGGFCGRKAGKHLLGPHVLKPMLQATFTSTLIKQGVSKPASNDTEIDALIAQLNELKVTTTDDIIDSFEWIDTEESPKQPIVTLYHPQPWQIFENYCEEQQPSSTASNTTPDSQTQSKMVL